MDNVYDFETHRDAKAEKSRTDDEPNPILSAAAVQKITNPPVRVTVAYLLFRLGAHPKTLALVETTNIASYEIHKSLIDSNCASMDDYIATVGRVMTRLTSVRPKHLVWSSNEKTGIVTVAYIR